MQIQIAENIKRFRIAQGFTQSDLAAILSVSTQAVSRWENGQAFPDITLLPLLAKYLNVSIDDLMGQDGQRRKRLKKELRELIKATTGDKPDKLQNELRILEIYEELGRTDHSSLCLYFQKLMLMKNDEKIDIKGLEERIANARQMIRERMRTSCMRDRIDLLSIVASCEEEDKLELWTDEYAFPEYMKANIWDELMLSRYIREKNTDKVNRQNQKILYEHIKNIVYYLTVSIHRLKAKAQEFNDLERYKMALDTISLYSTRIDDIFIFDRIVAEERYAQALLFNGYVEDSLDMFSQLTEHLSIAFHLPEDCALHGSVPFLDAVHVVVGTNDKQMCAMNLGKNPLFDQIRAEKRFVAYMEMKKKFLPQNHRSWVNESGNDTVDTQWEMLLSRARKEIETLSDGDVVVVLTTKGTVDSISFPDLKSSIEAEGAMRFFVEKKKKGDAKIERLICMWHDGSVDIPSFDFREALLAFESTNLSTKMLLNGLNGYVVKTVKATMPKGYKA